MIKRIQKALFKIFEKIRTFIITAFFKFFTNMHYCPTFKKKKKKKSEQNNCNFIHHNDNGNDKTGSKVIRDKLIKISSNNTTKCTGNNSSTILNMEAYNKQTNKLLPIGETFELQNLGCHVTLLKREHSNSIELDSNEDSLFPKIDYAQFNPSSPNYVSLVPSSYAYPITH